MFVLNEQPQEMVYQLVEFPGLDSFMKVQEDEMEINSLYCSPVIVMNQHICKSYE